MQWIIAGPNGAGKTTFALKHLPTVNCHNFVNADLIASRLSPLEPGRELVSASRSGLKRRFPGVAICAGLNNGWLKAGMLS